MRRRKNAESAIKLRRTIVRQRRLTPRVRILQGSSCKASARDACFGMSPFVDSVGRSMVEYGHRRMGAGVHEACNRAPPALADTGVEFAANAFWMFSRERWILNQRVWQRGEEMSYKKISVLLAAFLLIGLFLVVTASHYIGILRGESIVVSGTLQGVSWDEIGRRDYGLELYVNGDVYNIVRYSALSQAGRLNYGIEGDGMAEDVEILMRRLQQKIGQEIRLEYVQLAENGKLVVRLTIDGEEYIDEDEARRDHIRYQEAGRNVWITVCAITLLIWVIVSIRAFRK